MLPFYYHKLGGHKRLNEIVIAGTHDAGITEGGANVRTQDLDIAKQAFVGVRLFDLRVTATAANGARHQGQKVAQLKTYHAHELLLKEKTKTRYLPEVGHAAQITRHTLPYGGEFGQDLETILRQARNFVIENDTEFLILKFDKCFNWNLIAKACWTILKDRLYTLSGNLNTATLDQLRGNVVVVFTSDGLAATSPVFKGLFGVLGIRNLSEGGQYSADYEGLQYVGKGGTSITNPYGKTGENTKKQTGLMDVGRKGHPDAMGMMYWTSTGVSESIRERNRGMWGDANEHGLQTLWRSGLGSAVETRLPGNVNPTASSAGAVLKAFLPNIVMIDFADLHKCKVIYGLNDVAATALTAAAKAAKPTKSLSPVG